MKNTKEIKLIKWKRELDRYIRKNKIFSIIVFGTIFFSIVNIVLIFNFVTLLGKL